MSCSDCIGRRIGEAEVGVNAVSVNGAGVASSSLPARRSSVAALGGIRGERPSDGAGSLGVGQSFQDHMAAAQARAEPSTWIELARSIESSWTDARRAAEGATSLVPLRYRALLRCQQAVQQMAFTVHLAAQVAEGVSSTVRRVQQLGGS